MHNMANGVMNLFHRVPAAKNEEQHARMLSVFLAGEIVQQLVANYFLFGGMTRISFRHNRLGITLG